jgi:hypothetical protein
VDVAVGLGVGIGAAAAVAVGTGNGVGTWLGSEEHATPKESTHASRRTVRSFMDE